jgi:hypothetical protein
VVHRITITTTIPGGSFTVYANILFKIRCSKITPAEYWQRNLWMANAKFPCSKLHI